MDWYCLNPGVFHIMIFTLLTSLSYVTSLTTCNVGTLTNLAIPSDHLQCWVVDTQGHFLIATFTFTVNYLFSNGNHQSSLHTIIYLFYLSVSAVISQEYSLLTLSLFAVIQVVWVPELFVQPSGIVRSPFLKHFHIFLLNFNLTFWYYMPSQRW